MMSSITIKNFLNAIKHDSYLKGSLKFVRKVSDQKVCDRSQGTKQSLKWEEAKPYETIPGPKPLPLPYYGNFWRFMFFGGFVKNNFWEVLQKWHHEYGSIVRLRGIGPDDYVFLFDPDYFETMYRNDGAHPTRDFNKSIIYYREKARKDFYGDFSILTKQGPQWQRNRSVLNQIMINPKNAKPYATTVNEVAEDFIKRTWSLIRNSNMETPENFSDELAKYALESTGAIALGIRFGAFKVSESGNLDGECLATGFQDLLQLMAKLDYGPSLWQFFHTPTSRKFLAKSDQITGLAAKFIDMKLETLDKQIQEKNFKPKSIIESLYLKEKNLKMASVMANDMLVAGLEAIPQSLVHVLYCISKNPEKQDKLFDELRTFLPEKDTPINADLLNELKYLKACIKESFRQTPVFPGHQRRANQDFTLAGYRIPKGTILLTANVVVCGNEKYFKYPDKFIPERWLKSENNLDISAKDAHPFAVIPFGFGPRSCLGRRFAEFQYEILLAKILRNFKIEFPNGDMIWERSFITKCVKPLIFRLEDRP